MNTVNQSSDININQSCTSTALGSMPFSSVMGIAYSDYEGNILEVNDTLCTMLGYTREELLTAVSWREMTPPEYLPRDEQGIRELKEKGIATPFDKQYIRKDGSRIDVLIGGEVVKGTTDRAICYVFDITRQKQAEREIQAKEEHYRLVLEGSRDGIWDWDFERNTVCWNERFYDILGIDKSVPPFYDERGWDLIHPEDRERVRATLAAHLEQGEKYDLEFRMRHSSGEYRDVHARAQASRNEQGQPIRISGVITDITERKRMQEDLREHETRYQTIFGSSLIGIVISDIETRDVLEANDTFLEMIGYSREDLQAGRINWQALTPPEFHEANDKATHQIKTQGVTLPFQKQYFRKDGSRVDVYLGGTLQKNRPNRSITFVLDISEQKHYERALKESEARFRQLVDTNIMGMLYWNLNGDIKDANDCFLDMMGYTREELEAGQINWREMTPPEYTESDHEVICRMQAGETVSNYVKQYFHKDGHRVDVLLGTKFLPGSTTEGVCFLVNISERKQAQRAQEAVTKLGLSALSGTDLTDLLYQACELVSQTLDLNYAKVLENMTEETHYLRILAVYGFSPHLVGQIFEPSYEPQGATTLLAREPIVVTNIYTDPRFDPSPLHVEYGLISGITVIIEGPESGQPFGILQADANRKRTFTQNEIHFMQSMANVLAMAIERKRAEMEIEQANRKKSDFLAMISHELRTPLNAIIGYAQMIDSGMGGPITEKQEKYIRNVHSSANHLLHLINDLLDIAKVEAGKMAITPEIIDIKTMIDEVQSIMSELAHQKNVQLSFALAPGIGTIEADPARFKQIFINLISNAIKFNREGGSVWVRLDKKNRPEPQLVCSIQDTGIGIPENKQSELFKKFYQVDNTYSRSHEGTGLGLALTKDLIELHGGQITLESQEGAGSTFTIFLPLVQPTSSKQQSVV